MPNSLGLLRASTKICLASQNFAINVVIKMRVILPGHCGMNYFN